MAGERGVGGEEEEEEAVVMVGVFGGGAAYIEKDARGQSLKLTSPFH